MLTIVKINISVHFSNFCKVICNYFVSSNIVTFKYYLALLLKDLKLFIFIIVYWTNDFESQLVSYKTNEKRDTFLILFQKKRTEKVSLFSLADFSTTCLFSDQWETFFLLYKPRPTFLSLILKVSPNECQTKSFEEYLFNNIFVYKTFNTISNLKYH